LRDILESCWELKLERGIDYCQQKAQKKMRLDVMVEQTDEGISWIVVLVLVLV
jgi:hypothetical protein